MLKKKSTKTVNYTNSSAIFHQLCNVFCYYQLRRLEVMSMRM